MRNQDLLWEKDRLRISKWYDCDGRVKMKVKRNIRIRAYTHSHTSAYTGCLNAIFKWIIKIVPLVVNIHSLYQKFWSWFIRRILCKKKK